MEPSEPEFLGSPATVYNMLIMSRAAFSLTFFFLPASKEELLCVRVVYYTEYGLFSLLFTRMGWQ
ncbi:hypothetical protein BDB00DRAFT_91013 [Zychaea mexicana]|uniref:uncharacterized protein n=1 Tax=Zychaea mexicana TaxID=64656 RepID=UPI0022FEF4FC|nr:uncharacterized protein BDB00DRAFT_91013 [Zychaea mexicana]KAI9485056.1 hypothetical protein BDB00DRAFT_91013 [Zychaea mexicana]